jgi:hypothetical protein
MALLDSIFRDGFQKPSQKKDFGSSSRRGRVFTQSLMTLLFKFSKVRLKPQAYSSISRILNEAPTKKLDQKTFPEQLDDPSIFIESCGPFEIAFNNAY